MQAAIQAAMTAVWQTNAGPTSGTNMVNLGDVCRHRYGGPALRQLSFNWNAPDMYTELLSFEMEVTNTSETKTYELNEEEKVPIIKKWLGREGMQLM